MEQFLRKLMTFSFQSYNQQRTIEYMKQKCTGYQGYSLEELNYLFIRAKATVSAKKYTFPITVVGVLFATMGIVYWLFTKVHALLTMYDQLKVSFKTTLSLEEYILLVFKGASVCLLFTVVIAFFVLITVTKNYKEAKMNEVLLERLINDGNLEKQLSGGNYGTRTKRI